jgi:hypothetical protein
MRPLLINYLSQSEGAVTMDVKANTPVDIKCPFISYKPMNRLYNASAVALSSVTSFADFENAGALHFVSINPVESVSLTPSTVHVTIFAWATNVKLGTTTGTQLEILTESGVYEIHTESGEFDKGPVEAIASRAAHISSLLTTVPSIGLYAKASSMIFGAISSVAALFGWSRPPLIGQPMVVKNQPFQNGAQTIGTETTCRITLDPKQELTVDPRIVGIDYDELAITSIASRMSYLTTFEWADDDIVFSSIFQCRNEPRLETIAQNLSEDWFQPTAMSFAAVPFAYWNGTIKYRFEVVCSMFHRGKMAVYFEPNVS